MTESKGRITFVTGGARSGKSRFAQQRAEALEGRLLYVATAQARDAEMADRIAKHRADRGPRWITVEAPLDLAGAVRGADASPGEGFAGGLIDCLTLWTSNLVEANGEDEAAFEAAVEALEEALADSPLMWVVVTNEVGSGIVPAHALSRRFRDLAGLVNQRIAALADEPFLVVSGLPLRLG